MQTFLPYPDYELSAKVLDRARLGKQRSESKILLLGKWRNHPAAKMWLGHKHQLALYTLAICREWKRRGYEDTVEPFIFEIVDTFTYALPPPWLGDESFHASHRSNLLRKDPEHYGQFGWTEGPDLPYVWPKLSKIRRKGFTQFTYKT